MTQNRFSVTYEIVTEESAEQGDCAEHGFVLPGNWHIDIDTVRADVDGEYGMSLREAINLISGLEDSGSWFTEVDDRIDYRTGNSERRSLHPPRTITASSYGRLRRVLRAY